MTKTEVMRRITKDGSVKLEDLFPIMDIGQGYGFKNYGAWEEIGPDEVIYIPEYSYKEEIDIEGIYSKQDFIDLCNGDTDRAYTLFDMVDWQSPETLLMEIEMEEED